MKLKFKYNLHKVVANGHLGAVLIEFSSIIIWKSTYIPPPRLHVGQIYDKSPYSLTVGDMTSMRIQFRSAGDQA